MLFVWQSSTKIQNLSPKNVRYVLYVWTWPSFDLPGTRMISNFDKRWQTSLSWALIRRSSHHLIRYLRISKLLLPKRILTSIISLLPLQTQDSFCWKEKDLIYLSMNFLLRDLYLRSRWAICRSFLALISPFFWNLFFFSFEWSHDVVVMAGGGGGGEGGGAPPRELDQTSTWAVASVCAVIIVISILLEKVLHHIGEVIRHLWLFCFLRLFICFWNGLGGRRWSPSVLVWFWFLNFVGFGLRIWTKDPIF